MQLKPLVSLFPVPLNTKLIAHISFLNSTDNDGLKHLESALTVRVTNRELSQRRNITVGVLY